MTAYRHHCSGTEYEASCGHMLLPRRSRTGRLRACLSHDQCGAAVSTHDAETGGKRAWRGPPRAPNAFLRKLQLLLPSIG